MSAGAAPDRAKHALPFMIARTLGGGLAEISSGAGTVNRSNDLRESDIGCVPSEHVVATDTPLRTNEAGTFEGEQDLLKVWLGSTVRSAISPTEGGGEDSGWSASDKGARDA